jgi:hypothetical protein
MKWLPRIFNLLIAATAVVATVLLFSLPPLSFNSKIVVDVDLISKLVPTTEYTKDVDAKELLGTDEIQAGIKFKLTLGDVSKAKNGDKEVINERLLKNNLDDALQTLDKAIDILGDNAVRKALKSTIRTEVGKQIEAARPSGETRTADQLMVLLDLDDNYFTNFSNALYDEANRSGATVDSVGTVIQDQTGEVLLKAEQSGVAKTGAFTDEQKTAVKNNLLTILNQLEMVNGDGTIKPVGDLPYMYFIKFVKNELKNKVPAAELNQKTGETTRQYSDRLLETFVLKLMPDMFYDVIKYISLGIFISVFVLALIWLSLAAYEILCFIFAAKKIPIVKGLLIPLFSFAALIQIALGFVLTGVFKYVLPKSLDISQFKLPIKDAILIPRTFALGTSIVLIVTIALVIANFVLKKVCYNKKGE